jgi:hypothetical protein
MCINQSNTTESAHDPARRIGLSAERLDQIDGFVLALRDTLEVASVDIDQLTSRLYVVDFIHEQITGLRDELNEIVDAVGELTVNLRVVQEAGIQPEGT